MITTDHLHLDVDSPSGVRPLVIDLQWQAQAGECWCIVGRNGAGKSTLLRTLAGMRTPNKGAVRIQGRALRDWPLSDLARHQAYLPQRHHDTFGYRVIETVLTARHPWQDSHYWESNADLRAAQTALDALDVGILAERDICSLSGGERQRVAIATVLAQEAPLLLLDEPTNALDLSHQVSVMRLFANLLRTQNGGAKTIIFSSHDLNLARRIATHALLLMHDGTWRAGCIDDIFHPRLLSECLGHSIELLHYADRPIFLPTM